jgi:hypothetical protein
VSTAISKRNRRLRSRLALAALIVSNSSSFAHAKLTLILPGLRYEDLMISEEKVTKEALELADPDILKGRMRRLKLASDLSYKGKVLQDYAPDMLLEPFKFELLEDMEKIKARDEEIQLLNLHKK